jgi:hypothetical protein
VPLLLGSQLGDEAGEACGFETELQAVLEHVDPLDQELQQAGLLGREELGPERIEPFEGITNLALGQPDVGEETLEGRPLRLALP